MRIAILGASGMLGHKIYQTLAPEFPETFAIFHKPANYYSKFGLFSENRVRGGFEALHHEHLDLHLGDLKPNLVINCIGLTTRKIGGQRESDIISVNSVLPYRIKEWCLANKSRLIHFSTDCVFSGKSGPYKLESPKDAKDLYGQSKALGEVEGTGILTIRSSIIGREIENQTELLEWFIAQKGKDVTGFSGVHYSGVTTNTMAHIVLSLIKENVEFAGIQQLASEAITKHQLLSIANDVFAIGARITSVEQPSVNKVLLQSDFFNRGGFRPPTWRQQLLEVAKENPQYERWIANGEIKRKAS